MSTTAGRVTKHRSSQACHSCRMRKVRCDVLTNGSRCTNCRLDNTECVVLASRRGKHRRTTQERGNNKPSTLPPQSQSVIDSASNSGPSAMVLDHGLRLEALPSPTSPSSPTSPTSPSISPNEGDVPVCVTFDEDCQNQTQASSPCDTQRLSTAEGLPAFIAPLPSHVSREDLDFLSKKGAFTMAEPDLRAELLRSYVFSIHPFMPILNVQTFMDAISVEQANGGISLLLFQAVMFAGLASVDLHVIRSLGFQSTKQAREIFFTRVRLLYELDVESDEVAVLQSLLLMSWWYGSWKQRRHTWHWTGLALSSALNLGLHREPNSECGSDATNHFRRRLWWSLYIRDRLLALGTRRPMRIRDDSFNVAMLTLEDFEVQISWDLQPGEPHETDVEEAIRVSLMCVELAKLCIQIGHVLSSQYTTLNPQPNVPPTMMVVPKRFGDRSVADLDDCDQNISDWFQALPANVRRDASSSTSQGASHSCSDVHWSLVNILHLTLVNVLHRTQALQSPSDTNEAQAIQKASRAKVKEAARKVTKLAHAMLCRDQVRYMGVPGVTALIAASLSHMLDIRSGDEDVRDASIFRFYQSMQILQSLRGIYASADSAVSFLASVTRKAGISVPSQVATPAPDFLSATEIVTGPPSSVKCIGTTWKDAAVPQGRRWTISHSLPSGPGSDWHIDPLQSPGQSAGRYSQSSTFGEPSTVLPSTMSLVTPTETNTLVPHEDLTMKGFSMPDFGVVDASFYDWNNTLDFGIDLSPNIAFDVDFCSDTFGLLDSGF